MPLRDANEGANGHFQSLRDRKQEVRMKDYNVDHVIRCFLSWSDISLLRNSVSMAVYSRDVATWLCLNHTDG